MHNAGCRTDKVSVRGSLTGLRIATALAAVLAFTNCSRPTETRAPVVDPFATPAPRSSDANDVARFLAGLPGRVDSPYADLERTDAWQQHRKELDTMWKEVEAAWLPPMREFAARDLNGPGLAASTLFYPFSGPDALMLTVLFGNKSNYVMVGLEPAGTLPVRRRYNHQNLAVLLAKVRGYVYSELHRSFFITREMDRQFRGQVSDGLLEPILLLLARANYTVLGYRHVQIDEVGNILDRDAARQHAVLSGNKGVQVDVYSAADQRTHKFFYFSVNLSDRKLGMNTAFLSLLSKLQGMTTFLKATSYMPHKPDFAIICRKILEGSSAILQDDSGIPYHSFEPGTWQIQLYGSYERPYGSFRWLEQPDLRAAFVSSQPKPLGFRIGYGFSKMPSNLLLATKREGVEKQVRQKLSSVETPKLR